MMELDRDELGEVVREAWIAWARQQPRLKPKWFVPYNALPEADKEVSRQIGEAVAKFAIYKGMREIVTKECPFCKGALDLPEAFQFEEVYNSWDKNCECNLCGATTTPRSECIDMELEDED